MLSGRPSVAPFGKAIFEAAGVVAALAEATDGVVGIDAVWAAAVGDDVAALRELVGDLVEAVEPVWGDVHGAGEVTGGVLRPRAHVDDQHLVALEAGEQLIAADGVDLAAIAEVGVGERVEVVDLAGSDTPHGPPQLQDVVAGEPVVDVGALTAAADQSGGRQCAQVVRGVGDGLADLAGDLLDGALALGEELDDQGSSPRRERACDRRERVEELVLCLLAGCGVGHASSMTVAT